MVSCLSRKTGLLPRLSFFFHMGIVLYFCLCLAVVASGQMRSFSFPELITNGGYRVEAGKNTFSYRDDEQFIPASTLKVVTALAALDLLGPNFRFETHLFFDKDKNLYVKGTGDPFLTSEEILRLSFQLKDKGIKSIKQIYLDSSSFKLEHPTPGSGGSNNPYDASNGALAVNFNSIYINRLKNGTIVSGEVQTPLLPIMQTVPESLSKGGQRINIDSIGSSQGLAPPLQYTGELIQAQLNSVGIVTQGGFKEKVVPDNLLPILIYKNSKTLQEMLQDCLHYSNNFIANQIFLYCGSVYSGLPATWRKAADFMENYLIRAFDFTHADFSIHDGAGLSRNNRLTAKGLVMILQNFAPYSSLLNRQKDIYLKSGTLEGVYCYVGYFMQNNRSIPFALLLNQNKNTRERLLEVLNSSVFSVVHEKPSISRQ